MAKKKKKKKKKEKEKKRKEKFNNIHLSCESLTFRSQDYTNVSAEGSNNFFGYRRYKFGQILP